MATLKIDIINKAYEKGRISGLTSKPTPENLSSALGELEDMAALWAGPGKNICVGYNFEDAPDLNSPHNIPRTYHSAFYNNLAVIILSNFGKEALPRLQQSAVAGYSAMSNGTKLVRDVQPSRRMARGSGNRQYSRRYGWNYYTPTPEAPIGCGTNRMFIGNIDNFVEHFDSYLDAGEEIATYTLTADAGLTVLSQSLASPDVNYQIRADSNSSENNVGSFVQVKIVATTTTGRVETRIVDFELCEA